MPGSGCLMATTRLGSAPLSSLVTNKTTAAAATATAASSLSFSSLPSHLSIHFQYPKLSNDSLVSYSTHLLPNKPKQGVSLSAVVDEEAVVTGIINGEEDQVGESNQPASARPCELYVCNLPRSYDITELLEMFKPFGTVISVEVTKNPETGRSKGSGYVTMGSLTAARKAISALDGSDVGGREMRVRFSADISSGRRNPDTLNAGPSKIYIYESPYKIYVGNFAWTVKPEELRNHFSQFGTVVSARLLSDRKGGKNRTYAFLSFSTAAERDAALALDGTEFYGRILVVRTGKDKSG